MSLTRVLVLGVALVVATAATGEDKPGKVDPAKLTGDYKITEGLKAGEKAGADSLKGKVTFTKDKITIKGEKPEESFEFSYKLAADKSPAEIDMEITMPEALKGTKTQGILSQDGDTVKLCYHPMGEKRPAKFESTKENGFYLFTLKKAK